MPSYISSNANRFYTAVETSYAQAAVITPANRFPAMQLQAQQMMAQSRRLDKTGTRTFLGLPRSTRRRTAFQVRTYLTSWSGKEQPGYGPLFQATLGAVPQLSTGLIVNSTINTTAIQTTTPHGLSSGSAVSYCDEIRFVVNVLDASTFSINAPFSKAPTAGSLLCPTLTYPLSTSLPSVTLYDYWDAASCISRVIIGAAVDTLDVSVNGDYHDLVFAGPAADILDANSFQPGIAGLSSYPAEPTVTSFDYRGVPGHLGQVWLGQPASQFFTLMDASVQVKNNLETRQYEFGACFPKAVVPGERQVKSRFSLLVQDDSQTDALYVAARQRNSITAMLQLGQQQGQIMGIYMPNVTPEMPSYVDSDLRLVWTFNNNLAHGVSDDEVYIAFA
jgi:hypothetical protein